MFLSREIEGRATRGTLGGGVHSYPLGRTLPLFGVTGGGLLEAELREVNRGLLAHGLEQIDCGPLAFELAGAVRPLRSAHNAYSPNPTPVSVETAVWGSHHMPW